MFDKKVKEILNSDLRIIKGSNDSENTGYRGVEMLSVAYEL